MVARSIEKSTDNKYNFDTLPSGSRSSFVVVVVDAALSALTRFFSIGNLPVGLVTARFLETFCQLHTWEMPRPFFSFFAVRIKDENGKGGRGGEGRKREASRVVGAFFTGKTDSGPTTEPKYIWKPTCLWRSRVLLLD